MSGKKALHPCIKHNIFGRIALPPLEADQQPQQAPPYFSSLATLYAGACHISSWSDVDELDKLPALQELRLSGIPLLGQSKTGGRFEVRLCVYGWVWVWVGVGVPCLGVTCNRVHVLLCKESGPTILLVGG
jgi:hypothetical protein